MKRQSLKFKSLKKRIAFLMAVMMLVVNCMPAYASEIEENSEILTEEEAPDIFTDIENASDDYEETDVTATESSVETEGSDNTEEHNEITTLSSLPTIETADSSESVNNSEDSSSINNIDKDDDFRKNTIVTSKTIKRVKGSSLGMALAKSAGIGDEIWHEFDGIKWNVSSNGSITTLTISANTEAAKPGYISDLSFTLGGQWLNDYKNDINNVEFRGDVTRIPGFGFKGCNNLSSFTIPASVTDIGYGAFIDCTGLSTIGVETGNDNFKSHSTDTYGGLYKVNNPGPDETYELLFAPIGRTVFKLIDKTVKIGDYALYDCTGIGGNFDIPDTVTSIGAYAFYNCSNIKSINVGTRGYGEDLSKCKSDLEDIGQYCFENCSELLSVFLPTSIKSSSSVESPTFSNTNNPFQNCGRLKSIYLFAVDKKYNNEDAMFSKKTGLGLDNDNKTNLGLAYTTVILIPWDHCIVSFTSDISTKEKLLPVSISHNKSFKSESKELYSPENDGDKTVVDRRFRWWYKNENKNDIFTDETKVEADIKLTANWGAFFTYTFDAGEGDFKPKDYSSLDTKHAKRTVSGGDKLDVDDWPEDPQKDNALFVGWIAGDAVNHELVVNQKPNLYADDYDQFEKSEYVLPSKAITFTALYYDYVTVSFCSPSGNALADGVKDWLNLEINEYPSQEDIDHLEYLYQDYWTKNYNSDPNWEFQGWYSGLKGNGKEFDPYSPVPSDVYRQYNMHFKHFLTMTYYLHYDKDGDNVDDVISYDGKTNNIYANNAYTLIAPPQRQGYRFDGWWSEDGSKRYDSTLRYYEVTDNMNFHAHWKKLCKVTLHKNYEQIYTEDYLNKKENKYLKEPHVISDVVSGRSIMYDSMIPSDTVSNNWKFDGWYIDGEFDDESKKIDYNTEITDDIDVYAKWVDGGCSVVYWATTKIVEDDKYLKNEVWGKIVTEGTKIPIPSAEYNPIPEECEYYGYRFGGWVNDKGELVIDENGKLVDDRYKTIVRDTDFYSHWIDNGGPYVKQVQVIFNTMEGPEIKQPGTIDINTPIARPEDPIWENHKIVGWFTSPDFQTEWDFSKGVEEDMTLYAKWIEWSEEDEDNSHGIYWIRMLKGGKATAANYFKESGLTYTYDKSVVKLNKKSRVLKGKSEGETLITATKVDGTPYESSVRVFVYKQELKDMWAQNTSTVIEASEYLTVSGFLPDRWQSTKPSVATIDPKTGRISVKGRGSAKIKAFYGNKACVATLHCEVPKFAKSFYRMRTGQSKKIKIKKVKKYDIVSWNVISDDSVSLYQMSSNSASRNSLSTDGILGVGTAEIDNNGRLTALTAGDVIVQATVYGQTISCKVHIEPPILKKKSIVMNVNKTKRLKLSRTKLKNVEWTSTNDNVAYVDPTSGKVYGLKNGSATLRTTAGGVINTCTVRVQDKAIQTKGKESGAWGN